MLQAVKNERAEEINLEDEVEMILDKSTVAESKDNGEAERYV